jgi:hypothetical protein
VVLEKDKEDQLNLSMKMKRYYIGSRWRGISYKQ